LEGALRHARPLGAELLGVRGLGLLRRALVLRFGFLERPQALGFGLLDGAIVLGFALAQPVALGRELALGRLPRGRFLFLRRRFLLPRRGFLLARGGFLLAGGDFLFARRFGLAPRRFGERLRGRHFLQLLFELGPLAAFFVEGGGQAGALGDGGVDRLLPFGLGRGNLPLGFFDELVRKLL